MIIKVILSFQSVFVILGYLAYLSPQCFPSDACFALQRHQKGRKGSVETPHRSLPIKPHAGQCGLNLWGAAKWGEQHMNAAQGQGMKVSFVWR